MMAARRAVPLIAVVLALGACGGDDSTSETTAVPTGASPTTSTAVIEMVESGADTSATVVSVAEDAVEPEGEGDSQEEGPDTTLPPAIPLYEVIHRLIVDDRTTLVILVEPGAYTTVQLENLVYDVVDTYSPNTAIVVDDRAAADLAIKDDLTAEEQSTLDARTFLRIENGVDVTFHGPYADAGGMTVGS